jgi:hypothetical protein
MPDVSDRRSLNAWLDRMPIIENGTPKQKDRVVYKTVETPPQRVLTPTSDEPAETQTFRFMSDEHQALWDTWLWGHLDNVIDAIGEEVGALRKQLRDDLEARIKQLETDIGELRAVVADDDNRIAPPIALKGGRSNAA